MTMGGTASVQVHRMSCLGAAACTHARCLAQGLTSVSRSSSPDCSDSTAAATLRARAASGAGSGAGGWAAAAARSTPESASSAAEEMEAIDANSDASSVSLA